MDPVIVKPVLANFIKSLRDIGYTFEVAVADVLDNSITARANTIRILCLPEPEMIFMILDDGMGMSESELVDAMRLATNDPDMIREPHDLGRFGLGLKTASFSQCEKLTVISKKNKEISIKQWDLKFIAEKDEWFLITPKIEEYNDNPLLESLLKQDSGTLVIWQNIDSFGVKELPTKVYELRSHLSLVFHCFLEGKVPNRSKLSIYVNEDLLEPFNPFNPSNKATQEFEIEKIHYKGSTIKIQPYILPHHSKQSRQEFERYATPEGYTKSQGFYLYRQYRLLIYGTWWGIHKISDAHRLVRIKIDIPNSQDEDWGIDIKKSTAKPVPELRKDLKRIIQQVTVKGSRPYTGRGRSIKNTTVTRFWNLEGRTDGMKFVINREHPLLIDLLENLDENQTSILNVYLAGIEGYLPLDSITAQLYTNPHEIKQEPEITDDDLKKLVGIWKAKGINPDFIKELLKTEVFMDNKELLSDE